MMDYLIRTFGLNETERLAALTQTGIHILLILVGTWLLKMATNRGIRAFRVYMENRSESPFEKQRLETLGRVFRYVANVVITALAGMLIFTELGISIAPILATAGVLGLAIGFGAQSLVKDYFSGLFLLLEDQIRHGDVVEVDGKAGLVEEVTLRYVRLRSYDGNVHYVPNGQISSVTNMTREFSYAVVDVGIAYREKVSEVIDIINQVAADMRQDESLKPIILDNVEIAGVDNWADSAIVIKLRMKVVPIQQWTVKREFLRRLKDIFDERGIEIPFPHLTIYAGQLKDGSAPQFKLAME